jgi:hypothetical protein
LKPFRRTSYQSGTLERIAPDAAKCEMLEQTGFR